MNYRQFYAIKDKYEKELKNQCPEIDHRSGLYFLSREEDGVNYAYIGKSVNLLDRMVSHLRGYDQHIDISLKKRKWYSPENPTGWRLECLHFSPDELDKQEREYIQIFLESDYKLYNIESGGTTGKTMINERKPTKTYRDGLKQGYENARKEIQKLFEKNLIAEINGKSTKNKEKSLEKFKTFIKK